MSSSGYEHTSIEVTIDDGIATLFLNRPQVRNAIDDAMRGEMIDAIERLAQDATVRALVITGRGKGFCSGGDVKNMKHRLEAPAGDIAFAGWMRQQRTHYAMAVLHDFPKPTIAAVNGAATGLGCDLALCCDFIIASQEASFAMTYVLRGLIPDGGGMYFLPRRVGLPRAKELIFSGRTVQPDEALVMGMVDRVVEAQGLVEDARTWADELSHGSPTAIALGKSIVNKSFELSTDQVFALGSQAQGICYTSSQHLESVAAFVERNSRKAAAQ